MIPAVQLAGVSRLLVIEIALEETARLGPAVADADLTGLADRHFISVGILQHDCIHRAGLAHGTRLRGHADEVSDRQRRLCLAEALHDGDTCCLAESVEDFRIHCLARDAGVPDRGEVVLVEILLDEETVHGRRCAEGRDLVLGEEREQIVRMETVEVVNEGRASVHPLAVELAPQGFSPAGIGDRQMQSVCMYALPVSRCHEVTERVLAAVFDCLRITCRSRGEEHQHRVIPLDGIAGAAVTARVHVVFVVEGMPAGSRPCRCDQELDGRAVRKRILDLFAAGARC